MNANNKDLRFSFPLTDYYVAEKTGFKKRELLTKYDGEDKFDLIIIDDELQPHSLYEYISKGLDTKVGNDHIKSTNQHVIVSEKNNGFMSSSDKINLDKNTKLIENVLEVIKNSFTSDLNISDKLVNIIDDKLYISFIISAGMVKQKVDKIIDLKPRPENGYREEFIYVLVKNDIESLSFSEIEVCMGSDIPVYIDKNMIYLYKVITRNKKLISIDEPYGRKDDSILSKDEIFEIYEKNNEKELKSIRTNVSRNINSALLYIPFNGEDTDIMTNFSLHKYCVYKTSPFGKMLSKSINEGDYIQINKKTSNFLLEFLLDTSSLYLNNETIITLRDDMLDDSISISSFNNSLLITIGNDEFTVPIDCNIQYQFINLQFNNDKMSVYINGELNKISTFNKTYSNIRYIQVNSLNISVGEILISTQLNNIETCINKNNTLVSNTGIINNSPTLDKFTAKIGPMMVTNDHCICKFNLASVNNISKNDTVDIIFNEDLGPLYENNFTINEIYNNRLLVKDNNFNTDDDVVIYNGLDNLQKLYTIIKVDGDYVYLENILDSNKLGYNIDKVGNYVSLIATINGERLSKVYNNTNGISIMFDREYPLDTEIELEFSTISNSNNILNIGDIINVSFNGVIANRSDNKILDLGKDKITIKYNDKQIDPYKLSLSNLLISNDNVNLEVIVNMNDFINITNVDLLNKVLNISCHAELSSGSNAVTINNKTFNRGSIVSGYDIDNLYIDNDGYIRFNIVTSTDIKIGKILLNSLDMIISFKDGNLFTVSDNNNKLTDYLLINDDFIYTNSSSEISILYNE